MGPVTNDAPVQDQAPDLRDTGDSDKRTGERDPASPYRRDGQGDRDRSRPDAPASLQEDRGLTNTPESEHDSGYNTRNAGKDGSLQAFSLDPDERNADPGSGREHHAGEARDSTPEEPNQAGRAVTPGGHSPDIREIIRETPDTGSVFSGISGTLSDDTAILSGSPGDDAPPVPETRVHRDQAPGERQPAPPHPDETPGGKAPFADTPALPASGLPLGAAAGTTDATRTAVRGKGRTGHDPFWHPTDSALVLSPWMLLKLWCFFGFRRVLRKNVLESDERRSLYESIMQYPGVDLSRLTEMLRLNKETARYHLKMLAQNGKISGLIKQGIARYFPCRETISELEKTVIHYLWIGTTKRILLLLVETPGLTRQAIARELGIAGPSVTWQMQRLADDGLIDVRTEGRFVRYFLTPDSAGVLETVTKKGGWTGAGSS